MITQVAVGDITLNQGAYALTGAPGLEMPPVRIFSYDLAGEHFGIHANALYGRRPFSLQGRVIGESINDFVAKRAELANALNILSGEQAIVFTLSNGDVKQITAVLRSLDFAPVPGSPTSAPFSAQFEAAFPFLEGATLRTFTTGLALPGGGAVPASVPMSLNEGAGGTVTVTNLGNAPAYPIARITGPVTNPAINNNQGLELRFTITLLAGEFIDIDFKRKTVVDHTGRNRYDTKSGDWLTLASGTTTLKFVADSDDQTAELSVSYRDTYLNL